MKLPKFRGLLGGLAVLISAGFPMAARAQIAMKVTVEEVRMSKKPTATELKNPKSLARYMERKVIDQRTVDFPFGAAKEIALPNGMKLKLTLLSRNAEARTLKMHERTESHESVYENDITVHERSRFPINGGIYDKHMLVVWLAPLH